MRLVAAGLAVLALPATAAAEATIVSREVPLGSRTLAAAQATPRFNLVGVHWQGRGNVSFRVRSLGGRWSGWQDAAPEPEDGPDGRSRERGRRGWRIGNPYWTGPADRIEYRRSGAVTRLRAWFVWSPSEAVPMRTLAIAGAPPIVPRLSWGANEAIRRAPPSFAPSVRLAIVHHTAGKNGYSRAESAAIVRAIQLYHVRGNGWNDIGYNFLVDRFGQVFEGRYGGVERNVVGAHAQGFNTGSVGAAVLGSYGSAALTAAARDALVKLLAWRLDVAHVDPLSLLNVVSGGNPRFPSGIPVLLRAVAGHRDTGFTDCPGDALYARLGDVAHGVSVTGLPKLYAPSVRGAPPGPVRFTARLSAPLPWSVSVRDAAGGQVASGTGAGAAVDWTWDASRVAPGAYSYTIAAGAAVRPASGTVGTRSTLPTLAELLAIPAVISPNADGHDDVATVSYTLAAPATVTATLVDAQGTPVATLFSEPRPAGRHRFVLTADAVPDGSYRLVVTAASPTGQQATAATALAVSRILSAFAADRRVFSPNGDGRADRITFRFRLAGEAAVTLRVLARDDEAAVVFAGPLRPGAASFAWDGGDSAGEIVRDGPYDAELAVATGAANLVQRVRFLVDTRAPMLRLLSRRPLRLRVDEPADVVVTAGGRRTVIPRRAPGAFTVPVGRRGRRVLAVAWDRAGNRSRALIP